MSNDFEVWRGKDLSGLFRDIYNNQRQTQSQIALLIDTLRPLVKNSGDAAVIVPLIKEYLDVSVKNDSHLVRLAAIVEKLYAAEKIIGGGDSGVLSESEKQKLLATAEEEVRKLTNGQDRAIKQLETNVTATRELVEARTEVESEDEDEEETEE